MVTKIQTYQNISSVYYFLFLFTFREKFRSAVKGISQKLLGHEMMLVNSVEVRDQLVNL